MKHPTRATITHGVGLLDAAALALAGLTVLGALIQSEAGRASCMAPLPIEFEKAAIDRPLDAAIDAPSMLRDMLLYD